MESPTRMMLSLISAMSTKPRPVIVNMLSSLHAAFIDPGGLLCLALLYRQQQATPARC